MGQWEALGGGFVWPPEIVAWGAEQEALFVFGVSADLALWYKELTGSVWTDWHSLGGTVLSAPRAIQSGDTSVDVFAVGPRSELLHWEFHNGAWHRWPLDIGFGGALARAPHGDVGVPFRTWESLGGVLVSPPPQPVMFGDPVDHELLVFGVGTDHALWSLERPVPDGAWTPWQSFGHILSSTPSAVDFREEFVVFALGPDSAIWYLKDGQWQSLGGTFVSAPYAIATNSRLHVFAADQQSTLQHASWNGHSWSGWESRDGKLMSAPTAARFSCMTDDCFDVFVLGTDSAVWHRQHDDVGWANWVSLGGTFLAPPAAVGRGQVELLQDLVALSFDHSIWHMRIPPG
jgi:hypothetical protein